jgi:glycerol-3-phosphate dehydrogenase
VIIPRGASREREPTVPQPASPREAHRRIGASTLACNSRPLRGPRCALGPGARPEPRRSHEPHELRDDRGEPNIGPFGLAWQDAAVREAAYDVLVVGGGINGCGIARDAAGRGLSVLLCEQDDLAAHTSSASTKLIHGGLRYLEHYELGLVRKSLQEREVLLRAAPHIMWPLRFVMPHDAHLRPAWLIRAGLFLYDNLAKREILPGSASINLRKHAAGAPLQDRFRRGFIYSDGWADDARLVALNALDAAERGAEILTRTRCEKLERAARGWSATLVDSRGHRRRVSARAVVNATGPWVSNFLRGAAPVQSSRHIRLVKGSHIVVRKMFEHRFAYIFQNVDRRIIFAIPYEQDFTLIGTTDVDYQGDPSKVAIEPEEIRYLCALPDQYFKKRITEADVVWSYSGVRPLVGDAALDASQVTRDYSLDLHGGDAPLLSVFGGKITTYRKLSEEAVDKLAPLLGNQTPAWTARAFLPGGDLPAGNFAPFLRTVEKRYPWLPANLRTRYARAYGTRIFTFLKNASSRANLGEELFPQLYECEADYLCRTEWARTVEDILWRRTKLGLHRPDDAAVRLYNWLSAHVH